ncbi:MAG: SIMPL domain-containing protein [Succinivibrionaceae bacterium]
MSATNSTIASIICGLSIVASAYILQPAISNATQSYMNGQRTVTVKGLSEKIVTADVVTIPITYTETSNDMDSLIKKLEAHKIHIIDFLKKYGIKDSEITYKMPSINDNSYYKNSDTPMYHGTYGVSVYTHNIQAALNIMNNFQELIKQKVPLSDSSWGINFSFTKLNEIKPLMIEESTKNAYKAAEKFAIDSDSKVGKIKSASQGQFSISDGSTVDKKIIRVVSTVQYYLKD